jgi:hypothetical protein
MRYPLVILTAVAISVGAFLGSAHVSGAPASASAATAKARETFVYGHIRSLTRKGHSFEMRFDPAWWLTGVTAERAKREDTGSGDVTNDYYIVDEGHRLLTYVVPSNAHVTVLTRGQHPTATISVSELAQIVKGKNPRHRKLLERKAGFWIRIGNKYPSPALALDQQYQP